MVAVEWWWREITWCWKHLQNMYIRMTWHGTHECVFGECECHQDRWRWAHSDWSRKSAATAHSRTLSHPIPCDFCLNHPSTRKRLSVSLFVRLCARRALYSFCITHALASVNVLLWLPQVEMSLCGWRCSISKIYMILHSLPLQAHLNIYCFVTHIFGRNVSMSRWTCECAGDM